MILLLPLLLEDKAIQSRKEDVVISIPSQDDQFKSHSAADSINQVKSLRVSPVPSPELNLSAAESTPTDSPVLVNQAKPIEPPAAVLENKPAVSPAETKALTKEDVKAKPFETDVKPEDKLGTASIYVQIGVFTDPENVNRMQVQLSEKGLKSKSELIDTSKGKKTRLRVGPFSTKKDAELALVKLKLIKLTGTVVNN
jgi:DedD protein